MTHEVRPHEHAPPAAPGQPHDLWERLGAAEDVEVLPLNTRLARLVEEDPECAADLRELLAQADPTASLDDVPGVDPRPEPAADGED